MGFYFFCTRLLMQLMANKQDAQTPQVLWASFLTMVVMLLAVRCVYSIKLEALAFGSTAMCGRSTFWFWVIAAVPFYGATWENFFTNTLVLPVVNGPTEGLMLIYVAHFFTAFVGAHWWVQNFGASFPFLNWVPYFSGIPTSQAMLYLMTIFAVIPTLTFNIQNVYHVVKSRKGSMMLALAMLYPFAVLLLGVLAWDYLSPINLIGTYPHLVVAGTGLAFGFLVGRMILSHLCDEPKGLKTNMCMSLLYLPLAIANTLTARLNDGVPLIDEVLVLLGYCAFTAALYLHFATSVIHEITTALGISCFRSFKNIGISSQRETSGTRTVGDARWIAANPCASANAWRASLSALSNMMLQIAANPCASANTWCASLSAPSNVVGRYQISFRYFV
ncbi:hypothetical protein KSS87_012657 [Heliosperma pusillum]|nr:hypothetical protein KSS87_012657 [Heliosperma pusillum]